MEVASEWAIDGEKGEGEGEGKGHLLDLCSKSLGFLVWFHQNICMPLPVQLADFLQKVSMLNVQCPMTSRRWPVSGSEVQTTH